MTTDLHLHTTASDGRLTPVELVDWAKSKGLELISITDHDTVDGLEDGMRRAKELGVGFVRGSSSLRTQYATCTFWATILTPVLSFLKNLKP